MSKYFSTQETQDPNQRERILLDKLAPFINYAKAHSAYYAKTLASIDGATIDSRVSLSTLPITRKSDLIALQKQTPPFAGLTSDTGKIERIFQSPGPINEPENSAHDWWRMGQAFHAAGFRKGDKVQNCLSYHLTPGGFILDSGARACGCTVIPAGPGQTDQQLNVIESLQPQGYCGTPSFLKILLDKAASQQRDISSISKALVTGEAYLPALRAEFKRAGIQALQAYATADIGLIGYETAPHDGLIISEDIIVEIVRPGTLHTVADGEIGEVVVTSFNPDYPLIRFATGDLSAVLSKAAINPASLCQRTNMRIKGWLGRADQTCKVKGMFVHPEQLEKVRLQQPEIIKLKLQVDQQNHNDTMTLYCEVSASYLTGGAQQDDAAKLAEAIASSLKSITNLNGKVILVAVDSLLNDGKVITDLRSVS